MGCAGAEEFAPRQHDGLPGCGQVAWGSRFRVGLSELLAHDRGDPRGEGRPPACQCLVGCRATASPAEPAPSRGGARLVAHEPQRPPRLRRSPDHRRNHEAFENLKTRCRLYRWNWKSQLTVHWEDTECHINEKECRAALTELRRRARSRCNHGSRYLHLVDSMVGIAVLCRRRSSSHKLNGVVRKMASLELASQIQPVYVLVRSSLSPADHPSRVRKKIPK